MCCLDLKSRTPAFVPLHPLEALVPGCGAWDRDGPLARVLRMTAGRQEEPRALVASLSHRLNQAWRCPVPGPILRERMHSLYFLRWSVWSFLT